LTEILMLMLGSAAGERNVGNQQNVCSRAEKNNGKALANWLDD